MALVTTVTAKGDSDSEAKRTPERLLVGFFVMAHINCTIPADRRSMG